MALLVNIGGLRNLEMKNSESTMTERYQQQWNISKNTVECIDSPCTGDIMRMNTKDIERIANECLRYKDCHDFNSGGWIKRDSGSRRPRYQ